MSDPGPHFGCPGVDGPGGMGICVMCGQTFLVEVCIGAIVGKHINTLQLEGLPGTYYAHEECLKAHLGNLRLDVMALPDTSPLKRAYLDQEAKRTAKGDLQMGT